MLSCGAGTAAMEESASERCARVGGLKELSRICRCVHGDGRVECRSLKVEEEWANVVSAVRKVDSISSHSRSIVGMLLRIMRGVFECMELGSPARQQVPNSSPISR